VVTIGDFQPTIYVGDAHMSGTDQEVSGIWKRFFSGKERHYAMELITDDIAVEYAGTGGRTMASGTISCSLSGNLLIG
jgi:hypothetical protein